MERKQFLKTLGASAAFAIAFPCLHSCSSDSSDNEVEADGDTPVPTGIDFTIDLEASENAALMENGGFVLRDLVVVARNLEGEFVAASQVCSHQGYDEVRFVDVDGGIFYCDVHGSRFEQNGTPINQEIEGVAAKTLKVFNTELNDSMLRVFE